MTPSSPTSLPNDKSARMELFAAICDETAAPDQFLAFEELLRQDVQARDEFSQFVQMQVLLQHKYAVGQFPAEIADPAAIPPTAHSGSLAAPLRGAFGYFSQEIPLSYFVGTVLTALLVLIASLVPVSDTIQTAKRTSPSRSVRATPSNVVGRITAMADVKWPDYQTAAVLGANVCVGRTYQLASGLMEITYDTGAKVLLQGPSTYAVESRDGGFLLIGKLTARLDNAKSQAVNHKQEIKNPKSSLSTLHSPLFTIKTPTALVTDLGTEFGIEVSKEGTTTSHVFRGSVRVQIVSVQGSPEGNGQVLRESQSARVEKNAEKQESDRRVVVFASPANAADFVREIPHRETPKPIVKMFDLVDVVAGGNGFSGRRNAGIDSLTGRPNNAVDYEDPTLAGSAQFSFPSGDGKYHRVVGMPFVDGVFIPDGSRGPVQVDSAGHMFDECPTTSNKTAHYLWAGSGEIPTRAAKSQTAMGNIDYARKDHCFLFMHANKGVTFDLEAIRKAHPDTTIRRFLAVLGNAANGLADVWILIDGKEQFCRREISKQFVAMPVDIPIHKGDRFLTLVATDGGNGFESDWIMFGDPRLELIVAPSGHEAGSESREQTGKEADHR